MLRKIYDSLLTLAYPQSCYICGKSVEKSSDGIACENCWKKTLIFSGNETLCFKCGRFLSPQPTDFETFCRLCSEHFYDSAIAVGVYEHALAASVLNLKTQSFIGKRLENLFVKRFQKFNFQDISLIIPVPLSKKRFIERGFNQSAFLAGILAGKTGIKLDEQSLVRTIHTPIHRVAMDNKARELSVKNAFQVKRENFIKDRNIILIDDVFTSGATASGCAEVLKKSGAAEVFVFTLCRTV